MARPKASIRSRSKMATQALHTIIIEKDADLEAIRQYFIIKKEKGSRSVPKSVLSGPVISVLSSKLKSTSDPDSCVLHIVFCLEEFSSNGEGQDSWCKYYKEISQLMSCCFAYFCEARRNGTFLNYSRLFTKFCNIITSVAAKSDLLSAEFFNMCSKDMLGLLFLQNIGADLQSVILKAVSAICQYAPSSRVAETFSDLAVHVKHVAKLALNLAVETQMDIYSLLDKYLDCTKKEVRQEAAVWFHKWPVLRDAFIESQTKRFSEGCGLFLNKLYEVKTSTAPRQMKQRTENCSIARPSCQELSSHSQTKSANPANLSGRQPQINTFGAASSSEDNSSVTQTPSAKNELFKKPASKVVPATAFCEFKTPFPHRRPQNSTASVASNSDYSCGATQTPSTKSELFKKPASKVVPNVAYRKTPFPQRQPPKSSSIASSSEGYNSNVTVSPSTKKELLKRPSSVVTTEALQSKTPCSKPIAQFKAYQTPYYPDHRKSLSLRNKQEIEGSKKPQAFSEKNMQPKLLCLDKDNFQKFDKPLVSQKLSSKKEDNDASDNLMKSKRKEKVLTNAKSLLSSLGDEEDQSSKVTRWLTQSSYDTPNSGKESPVNEDHNPKDQYMKLNYQYSHERNYETGQKRASSSMPHNSKRRKSEGISLSSQDSKAKFPEHATQIEHHVKAKPQEESVVKQEKKRAKRVLYSASKEDDARSFVELEENRVRENTANSNRTKNHWEEKLKEFEKKRESEKKCAGDEYCFSALSKNTPAPTKFKKPRATVKKTPAVQKVTRQPKPSLSETVRVKVFNKVTNKENIKPKCGAQEPILQVNQHSTLRPYNFGMQLVEEQGTDKSNRESQMDEQACHTNDHKKISQPTQIHILNEYSTFNTKNQNQRVEQSTQPITSGNESESMKQVYISAIHNNGMKTGKSDNVATSVKNSHESITHKEAAQSKVFSSPSTAKLERSSKKDGYYSPILDDSMENVKSDIVTSPRIDSVMSKSNIKPGANGNSRNQPAQSYVRNAKVKSDIVTSPRIDPVMSTSNIKPDANGNSRNQPVQSYVRNDKANISCARDVDSGVEVTSNEGDTSKNSTATKKHSATSLYLRMRMQEYLQRATEANVEVAANHNVLTSEMLEIKGLVEKISASVSRCQTIASSNQQKLGDQADALQGCSAPMRDETYRTNYQEARRLLRARNTEKMLKTMKEVLEKNYPLGSSSESESE